MYEVTRIPSAIEQDVANGADQLLPPMHGDLRQLGSLQIAKENPGHNSRPTALVHMAYVRLMDGIEAQRLDSWQHFSSAGEVDKRPFPALKEGGRLS